MQNTSGSQLCVPFGKQMKVAALLCVVAMALACTMVAALPAHADAKSYSMPKVDIKAQVETDGSLHVVEQRTFDFNGDFTAIWWDLSGNFPPNVEIKINGVRTGAVNGDGAIAGDWKTLPSTPFVLDWRDAGGPGGEAYSFDQPQDTVYVFFNESDSRMMIELDYTVVNGAQAYEDVGELYWQYVGSGWAEPSDNVTMTLTLPVPQGTAVTPGDNVRAWGHGPLDGHVDIKADGSIVYTVPHVSAGQYAEARVVFPESWLTNLSPAAEKEHAGALRLDTVLAEEKDWTDKANNARVISLAFIIGCAVVCVLLLAWGLRSYFKYGKEHTPAFTDEYWRDVPDPAVHPAVIGRLWRWDRESPDDFTATLMHLAHIGAIRIDAGSYPEPHRFGSKEVQDYYITRLPAANQVTNHLDQVALGFLFGTIGGGRDALWFGSIKKYGKDHPEDFVSSMNGWQGALSAETNRWDFFEAKGKRYQGYLISAAVVLLVAGVAIWLLQQNFIPLIFMVPTAIALGVIANYMPRRSVEGNNLVAKCKALRNWLRDFSSLDERPPTDVKVWGEFMVYAYLFGVADEAIKQLQTTMPELFEYDGSMGMTYMPWWFWYTGGHTAAGTAMPSVSDLFQTSVANTMSTAQAAISGASGDFSSGGGFGGGFSGGGGGGFGGGGGGAR